jgi:hypothetical protein
MSDSTPPSSNEPQPDAGKILKWIVFPIFLALCLVLVVILVKGF